LVVKLEPNELDVRVITVSEPGGRGFGRAGGGAGLVEASGLGTFKEEDVAEAKRLALGVVAAVGVFTRAEKEEEANDGHILEPAPFGGCGADRGRKL